MDSVNPRRRIAIVGSVVAMTVCALVVAATVGWRGDSSDPAAVTLTPPSPVGAAYALDFRSADAAQRLTALRTFTLGTFTAPARIRDGRLTQGTTRATGATYFERANTDVCDSVGARGRLPERSPGISAIVLILTDGPIPKDSLVSARPNVVAHLVVTRSGWQLGVWPATARTLDIVDTGLGRVTSGQDLQYEIRWRGDTVTVLAGDGTSTQVRDKRFATSTPRYSTWELYQEGRGAQSPSLATWWARCHTDVTGVR